MRVLLVEDDVQLGENVFRTLRQAGHEAVLASSGAAALELAHSQPFDAMVLDVMLPGDLDGLAVCSALRREGQGVPIIMLTARDTVADRVGGLGAGADDYLVKPFHFDELLARLRALQRRHVQNRADVLRVGPLEMDTAARIVRVNGASLQLTAKDYAMLEMFMLNPGRILTREQINDGIWKYGYAPESHLVDVYVSRIRRKLAAAGIAPSIISHRGLGYRLDITTSPAE